MLEEYVFPSKIYVLYFYDFKRIEVIWTYIMTNRYTL